MHALFCHKNLGTRLSPYTSSLNVHLCHFSIVAALIDHYFSLPMVGRGLDLGHASPQN